VTVLNRVNCSVSLAVIYAQREVSFISYGDMNVCVTLIVDSTYFPADCGTTLCDLHSFSQNTH